MFMSLNQKHQLPSIRFGEVDLPALPCVKILGFILDRRLSMKDQIDAVIRKARGGIYALRLAGRYVDLNTRRIIHDSIIGCHLNYCDAVIGQAGETNLKRLQITHNKSARAVAKAPPDSSATAIRARLGWLDLAGKRRVHMATTVWKCLNSADAPEALSELIVPVSQVHNYATRGATSGKLHVEGARTTQASRSFSSRAPAWWNELPQAARLASSATQCRNITFHHLLEKAYGKGHWSTKELEFDLKAG